jgi:hypothetical protein
MNNEFIIFESLLLIRARLRLPALLYCELVVTTSTHPSRSISLILAVECASTHRARLSAVP